MSEQRSWSGGFRGAEVPLPDDLVHEVFSRQAGRTPNAVAVEFVGVELTYGELEVRAERLAGWLTESGVRPGAVVGVYLPRSMALVVAVLAVLKAGGAYLVLDPDHPRDRLLPAIRDAGGRTLIADPANSAVDWPGLHTVGVDGDGRPSGLVDGDEPPAGASPGSPRRLRVSPESLACVMFTSGSTGRPKAAAVSHGALLSWLVGQDFFDFSPDRTWLQFSPVSWDIFALELFGSLLFGGRCVLQPGQRPDVAAIVRLVSERSVDSLSFSSGLFALMVDEHPEVFASVRQVMVGGEPPSAAHLLAAHRRFPQLRLVNGYGAVETALLETFHVVGPADADRSRVPIGHPAANTYGMVLDERLRPVGPGEGGELYVAGAGLAHGYVGQPGLTASRFVAAPDGAPGRRMYRTGDHVRLEPDGSWALLGRTDEQVKVRGFRVDTTEIEFALCRHPDVLRAAVVVRSAPSGGQRIVAYVVAPHPAVDVPELLLFVRRTLPEHSVPDDVVQLAELPLRPNGKVDRSALPNPRPTGGSGIAPRDERERALCALFADVLGLPEVSVDDNFFRLGGDSLIATRVISRLRAEYGVHIGHRSLFEAPTVAELAPMLAGPVTTRPRPRVSRSSEVGT